MTGQNLTDAARPTAYDRERQQATVLVIDHVLHEVRRAVRRPVYRIHSGAVAAPQAIAVTFGWLAPAAREPRILIITDSGLKALAADASRQR